jgi:5-formyltetrahydrofolate cyclo-ligase
MAKPKPDKDTLRTEFLQKRDAISETDRARDSALIRQRVLQSPEWQSARTLLLYASFRSEVDTHKLMQDALAQKKRLVLPIADRGKKEIGLSELQNYGDLAPGAFPGIYEPAVKMRKRVDPSEIEVVLVPGIAFDRQGGRLGMGGGYFDKLLVEIPKARRIALAFSTQVHEGSLPLLDHDMPMHQIITEKETIQL